LSLFQTICPLVKYILLGGSSYREISIKEPFSCNNQLYITLFIRSSLYNFIYLKCSVIVFDISDVIIFASVISFKNRISFSNNFYSTIPFYYYTVILIIYDCFD